VRPAIATAVVAAACGRSEPSPSPAPPGAPVVAGVVDATPRGPTPPPDAGPPFPARSSVRARIEGRDVQLTYGSAYVDPLHLHVVVSDTPIGCDDAPPSMISMELQVPPGPGRRYYAGGAIGVDAFFHGPGLLGTANADKGSEVVLVLDEVGARVRGSIRVATRHTFDHPATVYRASGTIDVEVCGGADTLARGEGLPEHAPAGPPAGTLDGAAFESHSAIADLERDFEGRLVVTAVTLFEAATAPPCELASAGRKQRRLVAANLGGASGDRAYRGPQPADARFSNGGADLRSLGGDWGRAWVELDEIRPGAGGVVRGRLAAASSPDFASDGEGSVAGTFRATPCLQR
jgi:hypothetical protein